MDNKLLHILQHSLGLDQYGNGQQYRNHYVAGGTDAEKCRQLVAMGYMVEHAASVLSGGDPIFTVTRDGKNAVYRESPKPPPAPKLTASQKRYQEYLDCDYSGSFAEFLGVETECRHTYSGGYQYVNRREMVTGPACRLKKDAKAGYKKLLAERKALYTQL